MTKVQRIAAAADDIKAWPVGEDITQEMFDSLVGKHRLSSREMDKAFDIGVRWRVDRLLERKEKSRQDILKMAEEIKAQARKQAETEVLKAPLPWSREFIAERMDAVSDLWINSFADLWPAHDDLGDEKIKNAISLVCHEARFAFLKRVVELMVGSSPEVRA